MISRENFILAIESLRLQTNEDRINSELLEGIFPNSNINVYNNSSLFKSVIKLLQEWFPRDKAGFCEIEHYCFDLNFGKHGDNEVITAGDLYDRLVDEIDTKKRVEFHMKPCKLLDDPDLLKGIDSEDPLSFKKATKGSYASLDKEISWISSDTAALCAEKITNFLHDEAGQYVKPEEVDDKLEKSKYKADKYLADEIGRFNFRKPASENATQEDWKLTIKQAPIKGQFIINEDGKVPLEEIAIGLKEFIENKEMINRLTSQG